MKNGLMLLNMRKIAAHVENERGATLLMALLALLVAAMVSAVILAAAMSTIMQAKDDRTFQQRQLDLQSAGELTGDLIDNSRGGFQVTVVRKRDKDGNETIEDPVASSDMGFSDELCNAVKNVYYGQSSFYEPRTPLKIKAEKSASATSGEESFSSCVDASFHLEKYVNLGDANADTKQNTLVFTFNTADSAGGSSNSKPQGMTHTLYLKFNGKLAPSQSLQDGTDSVEDIYTWTLDRFYTADAKSKGDVGDGSTSGSE